MYEISLIVKFEMECFLAAEYMKFVKCFMYSFVDFVDINIFYTL